MPSPAGPTAVVTGGSIGIGGAIALESGTALGIRCAYIVNPPSMTSSMPVTNRASSLAR